jgi:hypothetical protein
LPFVDVHIVRTGGFNNFSLSYDGFKTGGGCGIVVFSSSPRWPIRNLKLCGKLYHHLEVFILLGQEDPIIFL